MDGITRAMMNLIGHEVCGAELNSELYAALKDEEKAELYNLSKKHDLAHIVGNALINGNLLSEGKLKEAYQNEVFTAVYRYETIAYELEELRRVFNEAKIPFIPLKGSVIRKYYPEPWQRTSCDIDILVHEEDLDRATKAIQDALGYSFEGRHYHDVSLFSQSGVHLELHFHLRETMENIDRLLTRAWEFAKEKENFEYEFSDEFLLFHIYAHASYHFVSGGCGIRTFLDVYLLNKKIKCNREKLNAMLEEAKIKKFAEEAENLAETWFGKREYTELTKKTEEYVLHGGVYGTLENKVAAKQSKKGKFGYALSRIWVPYDTLKFYYLALEKHKWLLPFYEIKRWFGILFKGRVKKSLNELKVNANLDKDKTKSVNELMTELELN